MHRRNILIHIQQDATLHSLFYLETALHVSGGTSTHHQERTQLYLQHLVFVTPLLLPAAIAADSSNGVTNTRCCRYSRIYIYIYIKVYSNIYPTRCNVTQFILSGNCSTCFGWCLHPSSRVHTTVSAASGICHTVTAICRYSVTPIIRSAYNSIYSIWYLSHR